MSEIIEQVKQGLADKVAGIETALLYVRDIGEVERLNKDLAGARAALAKLDEEDTRSPEELEKIANMIDSSVSVETAGSPWDSLTPIEKFQYQVSLYSDKLRKTLVQAKSQYKTLSDVCRHLRHTADEDSAFMEPVIKQFEMSRAEVGFSIDTIVEQLSLEDKALTLIHDKEFFDRLEFLNRFLNNPMNLPHLSEERDARIRELRDGEKG